MSLDEKCSYKLRVDLEIVNVDQIVHILRDSICYAYVREKMDTNPHVHFFISTRVKEMTIRARLRKLNIEGNKCYSLKELTEEYPVEYLAYMLKEGKVTWVRVPQDIIDLASEHQLKVIIEIKKKKEAKKPVWQQILELCDAIDPYADEADVKVGQVVLKFYIEQKTLIRKFMLVSIVETVLLNMKYKQCPDSCNGWLLDLLRK